MSINRWMDKEDVVCTCVYVYTHNGILLSHKRELNNAICSNMSRPRDYHTKGSKSDREIQISYEITYMWNLKKWYKWTYLQNRNRLRHKTKQNKLTVTKGERVERDKLGIWD